MNDKKIVLVRFPFTNLETTKKRPALVIRSIEFHKQDLLLVAMITSQIEGKNLEGDVLLADWQSSNLLYPSIVRLAKMATIESELVDKTIGKLSRNDEKLIAKNIQKLFKAWL